MAVTKHNVFINGEQVGGRPKPAPKPKPPINTYMKHPPPPPTPPPSRIYYEGQRPTPPPRTTNEETSGEIRSGGGDFIAWGALIFLLIYIIVDWATQN